MALNHPPQHGSGEAEYLQGEMMSDIRHEYIFGEIHMVAGAGRDHQRISRNISLAFTQFLDDKPCEPFTGEMTAKADNCFFYPDILVVCGDEQGNDYYTEQPCIFIEILSKTARRLDQTTKLTAYKRLPSLNVLDIYHRVDNEDMRDYLQQFAQQAM